MDIRWNTRSEARDVTKEGSVKGCLLLIKKSVRRHLVYRQVSNEFGQYRAAL